MSLMKQFLITKSQFYFTIHYKLLLNNIENIVMHYNALPLHIIITRQYYTSLVRQLTYGLFTFFQKLHFSKSHFFERPQERYYHFK